MNRLAVSRFDWRPSCNSKPTPYCLLAEHPEPYRLLSWGGGDTSVPGQAYLLAAASSRHLDLFSLDRFFTQEAQGYTHACRRLAAAAAAVAAGATTAAAHATSCPPSPPSPLNAPSCWPQAVPPADPGPCHPDRAIPGQTGGNPPSSLTVPVPSRSWDLLARIPLHHPLLAMDWTLREGGLMLSDGDRNVTMLAVRTAPPAVCDAGPRQL